MCLSVYLLTEPSPQPLQVTERRRLQAFPKGVQERGGGFTTENLFMRSLTKDQGNPLLDLPSVSFWQVNNNLNLVVISFKGMFLGKKNSDSINVLLKMKRWIFLPPSLLATRLQIFKL